MVLHPGEYPWSSYTANAHGVANKAISPHVLYEQLGADAEQRQVAYRELFRYQLDPGLIDEIRHATNGNFALGTTRFQEEVSVALGRRVIPGKSGRPKKEQVMY
jgi:putative transposase